MDKFKVNFWHPIPLLATFFGIGKIPFMSGTFGSLVAYLVLLLKSYIIYLLGEKISSITTIFIIFIVIWLILLIAGTYSAHYYAKYINEADPKSVVIDEVVGQLLTLYLTLPLSVSIIPNDQYKSNLSISSVIIIMFLGPFLSFRLFDIIKPWPINWCDKKIKGGIGIMLDDVVAAIMASLVFNGIIMVLIDQKII